MNHTLYRCIGLALSLFMLLSSAADLRAEKPVITDSFDDGSVPGAMGNAARLQGQFTPKSYEITSAFHDRYTLAMWINIDHYPDEGKGLYNDDSPMVLADLWKSGGYRTLLRLHGRHLQLAYLHEGTWSDFHGEADIEPGSWYHVAYVRNGPELRLYVNGQLDAFASPAIDSNEWQKLSIGAIYNGSNRFFQGAIDEVRFFGKALSDSEILEVMNATTATPKDAPQPLPPDNGWMSYGQYNALLTQDHALHPLIDQLSTSITIASWTQPDSNDLIVAAIHRDMFGARMAYFQQVGVDDRGLPIYDTGTPLNDLAGTHFAAVTRPDGLFDLFARGESTIYGSKNIVQYINRGKPGAPTFDQPTPVRIAGQLVESQLTGDNARWSINDIDGDDIADLLLVIGERKYPYMPDTSGSFYTSEQRDNTGPGRGYDIEGNWLGGPLINKLYWAKGSYDDQGALTTGPLKLVQYGLPRFAVQWVSTASEWATTTMTIDGKPYLICVGNVDRIYALPIERRDGEIFCGKAQPLLRSGPSINETYIITNITVRDLDGDGKPELLLDGNPGRAVVLRGDHVGEFEEVGSLLMQGGPLAVDTLAVPDSVDWNGDGYLDLIIGDSSGYLTFWPGTADPLVYGEPIYMKSTGQIIHQQAGMTGSIQGPSERRWGYLNPAVGDWDGDGQLEIITNNTAAELTYYDNTDDPTNLAPAQRITLDGQPLPAAWRARPQIINWHGKSALLYVDWDGDLAVATPISVGSTHIGETVKLRYDNGNTVRLCGMTSAWGRVKIAAVDWDGDGDWDLLFGTNRACYKFITENNPAYRSTPMWLQNIGTNDQPRFVEAQLITMKDGSLIDFGVHVASVCPRDLDHDGKLDLLLGGEDGKVYYFKRDELKW